MASESSEDIDPASWQKYRLRYYRRKKIFGTAVVCLSVAGILAGSLCLQGGHIEAGVAVLILTGIFNRVLLVRVEPLFLGEEVPRHCFRCLSPERQIEVATDDDVRREEKIRRLPAKRRPFTRIRLLVVCRKCRLVLGQCWRIYSDDALVTTFAERVE